MKTMTIKEDNLTISFPEDCGNAPKKVVLRDFMIAIAKQHFDAVVETIADTFTWEIVGTDYVINKEATVETLKHFINYPIKVLHIKNIITHGKTASLHGVLIQNDGSEQHFCHVFVFSSAAKHAKLKEMTSYVITKQ